MIVKKKIKNTRRNFLYLKKWTGMDFNFVTQLACVSQFSVSVLSSGLRTTNSEKTEEAESSTTFEFPKFVRLAKQTIALEKLVSF